MQNYANNNEESGVLAYEIGADYITVQFKNGQFRYYKYTYNSAGKTAVDNMKVLAEQGQGLNSFISTKPQPQYDTKW